MTISSIAAMRRSLPLLLVLVCAALSGCADEPVTVATSGPKLDLTSAMPSAMQVLRDPAVPLPAADRAILERAPEETGFSAAHTVRVRGTDLRGRHWIGLGLVGAQRETGVCIFTFLEGQASPGAQCFEPSAVKRGIAYVLYSFDRGRGHTELIGLSPESDGSVLVSAKGERVKQPVVNHVFAAATSTPPVSAKLDVEGSTRKLQLRQ